MQQEGRKEQQQRTRELERQLSELIKDFEAQLRDTVKAIKDMDIDYVIPLHCTGEPFYETAKAEITNKLLRSYTGTRLVFSA